MNWVFVILYYSLCCVYYYIEWFCERNVFYEATTLKSKDMKGLDSVRFCSDIDLYKGDYTYSLETFKNGKPIKAAVTGPVGKLFDSEGYLHQMSDLAKS